MSKDDLSSLKKKGKRGRVDAESADSRHHKHSIKQKKEMLREDESVYDEENGIDYHKYIR